MKEIENKNNRDLEEIKKRYEPYKKQLDEIRDKYLHA